MSEQKVEKKSIWDKIGNLDYRIIYVTFIVMLVIPVIQPLGIPMKIGPTTKDYYNAIMNLPAGSVILIEDFVSLSVWADTGPIMVATWKILWSIPEAKDITIIEYTAYSDGAIKMPDLMAGELKPPQWRENTYGETWVNLGYISGLTESGLAALAMDFKNMVLQDSKGTPIMDIPVIQEVAARGGDPNVLDAYDFDLFIWGSWTCTVPDTYVRQFWVTGNPAYALPMLFMTIGNCVPNAMPYYGADKPLKGFIPGAAGAAELELLSGFPGDGIKMADLNDLGGVATVFFLILGNLSYFGKRFLEKKEV